MPFQIIRNDITKVKADAIVNTANPHVAVGAGVDSAIYHTAGFEKLLNARREIGELRPGEVGVTEAFALNAKWIIHRACRDFAIKKFQYAGRSRTGRGVKGLC